MAKLIIEKEAAQKILDYLATRPFAEVYNVVPLILNLPVVPGTEETEPEARKVEAELVESGTEHQQA